MSITDQSRIPPRPRESWDSDVFEALAVLAPPGTAAAPREADVDGAPTPPVSNILGIFAWHPSLMKAWLQFNGHLFHSTLSDRIREMVTVRVAWVRQGEYEWAQHVRMARAAGLTADEVAAISDGPDAALWSGVDAAVLRAADELCGSRCLSDTTWAELLVHLDRQQVMDLVFTAGAYDLLAMAMHTFGLELDPDLPGFPDGRSPGDQ